MDSDFIVIFRFQYFYVEFFFFYLCSYIRQKRAKRACLFLISFFIFYIFLIMLLLQSQPGYVLGLQLLSPIHNRSTENIFITDSHVQSTKAAVWNVKRDLSVFPTTSTSFGVAIEYHSGNDALGGAVLVVSSLPAPIQNIPNRIVKGPVPSLVVYQSRIKGNQHGLWNTYYNR